MFASIRRYRLVRGSMEELMRRVDASFADDLSAQPGFVSYEFMDCGDGEVMTVSVFREARGADASRELAARWTQENLESFEFTRLESLRGEIMVSRAAQDMLAPAHAGATDRFASIRRYRLRSGSIEDLVHIVDETFADRISEMDGFEAYHVVDCGAGEIMSVSFFRDQATAEESDDRALQFVRDELGDFDIERTEIIGGEVAVTRAMEELLEPAHA
jgi:heme-degrading monooxygenase HmoA